MGAHKSKFQRMKSSCKISTSTTPSSLGAATSTSTLRNSTPASKTKFRSSSASALPPTVPRTSATSTASTVSTFWASRITWMLTKSGRKITRVCIARMSCTRPQLRKNPERSTLTQTTAASTMKIASRKKKNDFDVEKYIEGCNQVKGDNEIYDEDGVEIEEVYMGVTCKNGHSITLDMFADE